MLLGEGRNERHLCSGIGRGRANLLELSTQVLSSLLATRGCRVEIRIVNLLGHEHDIEVAPGTTRRSTSSSSAGSASTGCQQQQHKNQRTGSQCLKQPFHCLLLYIR